jgi:hypothetical protein
MARRTIERFEGTFAVVASRSEVGTASGSFVLASDRCVEHVCGASPAIVFFVADRGPQHPPSTDLAAVCDSAVLCRSRSRRTASSTRRALAQANRSAAVWQQHLAKHCFAELQPQGLFMQGNGLDRSFSAKRAAIDPSSVPTGKGNPDATSACTSRQNQTTARRRDPEVKITFVYQRTSFRANLHIRPCIRLHRKGCCLTKTFSTYLVAGGHWCRYASATWQDRKPGLSSR